MCSLAHKVLASVLFAKGRRKIYRASILTALQYDSEDLLEMLIFGNDMLPPVKKAAILTVLALRNYGLRDSDARTLSQRRIAVRKALKI